MPRVSAFPAQRSTKGTKTSLIMYFTMVTIVNSRPTGTASATAWVEVIPSVHSHTGMPMVAAQKSVGMLPPGAMMPRYIAWIAAPSIMHSSMRPETSPNTKATMMGRLSVPWRL